MPVTYSSSGGRKPDNTQENVGCKGPERLPQNQIIIPTVDYDVQEHYLVEKRLD